MFFIYKEKKYDVNVKNVIEDGENEFIDSLNAFGVILHNFSSENPAESITIMLMLDINNNIRIEVNDEENDEYCIINPTMSEEEQNMIIDFLKCD